MSIISYVLKKIVTLDSDHFVLFCFRPDLTVLSAHSWLCLVITPEGVPGTI